MSAGAKEALSCSDFHARGKLQAQNETLPSATLPTDNFEVMKSNAGKSPVVQRRL